MKLLSGNRWIGRLFKLTFHVSIHRDSSPPPPPPPPRGSESLFSASQECFVSKNRAISHVFCCFNCFINSHSSCQEHRMSLGAGAARLLTNSLPFFFRKSWNKRRNRTQSAGKFFQSEAKRPKLPSIESPRAAATTSPPAAATTSVRSSSEGGARPRTPRTTTNASKPRQHHHSQSVPWRKTIPTDAAAAAAAVQPQHVQLPKRLSERNAKLATSEIRRN